MTPKHLLVALASAIALSACAASPSGSDTEGSSDALRQDSSATDDKKLAPGTYTRAGGFHLYVPGPCGAGMTVLGDGSRDFAVTWLTGDYEIPTNDQSNSRVRGCGAWTLERVKKDVVRLRWKSSEADRGLDRATIAECKSPEGEYTMKSPFAEHCPDPHHPEEQQDDGPEAWDKWI